MAKTLAVLGPAIVLRRLSLALFPRARGFDAAARRLGAAAGRRFHLQEVRALASIVLLVSACGLVATLWYFSIELDAMFADVTAAPPEVLRPLAPAPDGQLNIFQEGFRQPFILIVNLSILAWYGILRMAAKKQERVHWAVLAGGAAVIVLTLGAADFPYRLTNVFNRYDAVRWQDVDCYVIGERTDELLLFCPSLGPSRNRVVKAADPTLERTGIQESIFTPFGGDKSSGPRTPRGL